MMPFCECHQHRIQSRAPRTVLLLALLSAFTGAVSSQAPATDIVVLEQETSSASFSKHHRITDRAAYDNQPKFLPDGRLVYTAAGENTTEIHAYDFTEQRSSVLFALDENLYSPTPVPDQSAISVIRDYGNEVQQLWLLPLNGTDPRPLQTSINPIGYHAWRNDQELILFVLGTPQTLQLMRVGSGDGRTLHDSPGRALAKMPEAVSRVAPTMTFTRPSPTDGANGDPTRFEIVAFTMEPQPQFEAVVVLPSDNQDYAWAPDGSLWTGRGTELLTWTKDDPQWSKVDDLSRLGFGTLSRLAWSDDGSRLAVVVERSAP